MEDELTQTGVTQQSLQSELVANQTAGTYTSIFDVPGNTLLTAQPSVPTLFVFSDISIATDTIVGFDPTRDTIQLSHTLVPDVATVLSDTTAFGSGSLITLVPGQKAIVIDGIAPNRLGTANFNIV
jgi:hypothetical protein